MIELEAGVLRDLSDTVTEWVAGTVESPPGHVLDLGSGPGAGTLALLRRFPDARLTAMDSSPQMLARHATQKTWAAQRPRDDKDAS